MPFATMKEKRARKRRRWVGGWVGGFPYLLEELGSVCDDKGEQSEEEEEGGADRA